MGCGVGVVARRRTVAATGGDGGWLMVYGVALRGGGPEPPLFVAARTPAHHARSDHLTVPHTHVCEYTFLNLLCTFAICYSALLHLETVYCAFGCFGETYRKRVRKSRNMKTETQQKFFVRK